MTSLYVNFGPPDQQKFASYAPVEESKRKDDIALWPPVEFGQIYTYLIDMSGQFTREKMKAYKSLVAFNYYFRYRFLYLL